MTDRIKEAEYNTSMNGLHVSWERMPIPHKIRPHQRQHIGRSTSRKTSKALDRHNKHHFDGRTTRSSRANSEVWFDFNVDAPVPESDEEESSNKPEVETSELVYTNSCKKLGVIPRNRVLKHLKTDELLITDGRLALYDIQPLAYSLTMNNTISTFDVSGNQFGSDGLKQFVRMLEENVSIIDFNVSYNGLGSDGAILLQQLLSAKTNLISLNASGNNFGNDDADYLSEGLVLNHCLRHLNLSNNNFQEQAGIKLAEAIENNDCLTHLDLSWNQLRLAGAVAIGISLQNNETLRDLNISWNGFSDMGCEAISRSLVSNTTLETLDISSNRIGYEGCHHLAKALAINETLGCLKINSNSLSTLGAMELLAAIKENYKSAICRLELQDVPVVQGCLEIIKEILEIRENFQVLHDVKVLSEDFIVYCIKKKKLPPI